MAFQGDTVWLQAQFVNSAGAAADVTDVTIKIYDTNKTLLDTIEVTADYKVSLGFYSYPYTIPYGVGNLVFEYSGTVDGKIELARSILFREWI